MKEKQVVQEAFTELSSHYEETIDGELNTFWGWSYQNFIDQIINQTKILENQKILDIATGTSVIPRKIIKKKIPGIHITGLDITESMLRQGKQKVSPSEFNTTISLTCADAMALPFSGQAFDVVVSGLASHHMDIPLMLSEMKRVIKPGGMLSIIDVAISPIWEHPVVRGAARIGAFIYFLIKENLTRARAEFDAPINVRTPEGWQTELETAGFQSIKITKLSSKYRWIPAPLTIQSIV
ncbi:MAG: class I SAM-dependent methyltransferase [Anaerolineales bacterium]|nr:class I SAM-dependent methyltransferase [Anaerolineales bacterium]